MLKFKKNAFSWSVVNDHVSFKMGGVHITLLSRYSTNNEGHSRTCMMTGEKLYSSLDIITTLAHMLNGYEICLNRTNYPIFNMHDFIYCLCTTILDCFGQLVSPLCLVVKFSNMWYCKLL